MPTAGRYPVGQLLLFVGGGGGGGGLVGGGGLLTGGGGLLPLAVTAGQFRVMATGKGVAQLDKL